MVLKQRKADPHSEKGLALPHVHRSQSHAAGRVGFPLPRNVAGFRPLAKDSSGGIRKGDTNFVQAGQR
ncbi:MAG: hypothetical protein WBA57_21475 [Elainellaceae cyanobacterium]